MGRLRFRKFLFSNNIIKFLSSYSTGVDSFKETDSRHSKRTV